MKKIANFATIVFITLFCFLPVIANAKIVETNFKETVDYEIEVYKDQDGYEDIIDNLESIDFSNYEQSNKKVNVYIFRRSTCGYCLNAVNYFASLYDEYGDKFDLKTYEVWYSEDNADLMTTTAKKLGVSSVEGVPFIIIGDKYWEGFNESLGDEMFAEIMDQYESDERYDVMLTETENNDVAVIVTISVLAVAVIALLVVAKVKTK